MSATSNAGRKAPGSTLLSAPPVDFGDDVVDLSREVFDVLGRPAVFAATAGAPPDQFFERAVHRRSRVASAGLEDAPCADFQDRQERADPAEVIEFGLFFVGESAAPILLGQVVHPRAILIREREVQDAASGAFRHGAAGVNDPLPDVGSGSNRRGRHDALLWGENGTPSAFYHMASRRPCPPLVVTGSTDLTMERPKLFRLHKEGAFNRVR